MWAKYDPFKWIREQCRYVEVIKTLRTIHNGHLTAVVVWVVLLLLLGLPFIHSLVLFVLPLHVFFFVHVVPLKLPLKKFVCRVVTVLQQNKIIIIARIPFLCRHSSFLHILVVRMVYWQADRCYCFDLFSAKSSRLVRHVWYACAGVRPSIEWMKYSFSLHLYGDSSASNLRKEIM